MDAKRCLSLIDGTFKEEFGRFKEILLEYNQKFNLTAVCDDEGIKIRHFLDSILPYERFKNGAKIVEIGSGGGFPSVPLKIVRRDLKFTLIESTGKKCGYLNEVVDKLGLDCVKVMNIRAEDGGRDINLREKFDYSCARAVARLNTLCEYCLPFVKVGGSFIAYKGECDEEIEESKRAVEILGGAIADIEKYALPDGSARTLIEIKKVRPTPAAYPRGNGKERKKPL